ncbi:MAG: transposase [Burkholderiaceae bacterium]
MHPKSGPRRRHSDELKAKVLAACDEPGASIAGVALAHGLNTNLVRKWRSGRGAKRAGVAITRAAANKVPPTLSACAEFVAVEMPASRKAAKLRRARRPRRRPPRRSARR